jgi:prepilin peptidase dependent protein B
MLGRMKNMVTIRSQAGFTITEMLITIALSLSVMSSVMVGYLATYTSSMDTLAASKMNQDINAVMALMISELRRSGYSGDAATATNPTTNVFNQVDDTAMEVFDSVASNVQMVTDLANGWINTGGSPAATQGTCIVYAYDADEDGVVDTEELGGFRLNNGAVDFRRLGDVSDPDTCSNTSNTWEALTDNGFITVSALNFNLDSSECLNTSEPNSIDDDGSNGVDDAAEYDCYDVAPDATEITVETRQITITATANLSSDSFVQISQTQEVRVRNELVRIR